MSRDQIWNFDGRVQCSDPQSYLECRSWILRFPLILLLSFSSIGCSAFEAGIALLNSGPNNDAPEPPPPKIISKIISGFRTCINHDQGTHCWGSNSYGEVGLGYVSTSVDVATEVSSDLSIRDFGFGYRHTCFVRNSGVVCVGMGSSGELGDGALINSSTLIQTIAEGSDVTDVEANGMASCAVRAGGLFCWGNGGSRQLGHGATTNQSSPTQIFAAGSGVTKVAMGSWHTCAIVATELWCWGTNNAGQVGDGTTANRLAPVKISSLGTGVTDVSLGESHSCAVKSAGIYCWGVNGDGQVGDGTLITKTSPTLIVAEGTGVEKLSVGDYHSCAIYAGSLNCWGRNLEGQMNDLMSVAPKTTPSLILDSSHEVTHLATGPSHICVVKAQKNVVCWGSGNIGTGAAGSSVTWVSPQQVVGLTAGVEKMAKSDLLWDDEEFQNCAIQNGGVRCWGTNQNGILGTGNTTASRTPVVTIPDGSGVTDLALISGSSNSSTCAVVAGGIKCWGATYGLSPMDVLAPGSGATAISLHQYTSFGVSYGCAIVNGGARCWGANDFGELGNGTTVPSPTTPVVAIADGSSVTKVEIRQGSSCAIVGGGLRCWGANEVGQLGDGTTVNRTAPVQIVPGGSSVTDLAMVGYWNAMGSSTTCAVVAGGLRCWGYNADSLVGDGSTTNRSSPVQIFAAGSGVTRVGGFYRSMCAIKNGGLYCWGYNFGGGLGVGDTLNRANPALVIAENSGVTDFALGVGTSCAVVAGGLKCWGRNAYAAIGDGSISDRVAPVTVFPAGSGVQEVRSMYYSSVTCARVNNAMKCWGQDPNFGLIGNGKVSRGEFSVDGF